MPATSAQVDPQPAPRSGRRDQRYKTQSILVELPVAGRVVNVGQRGLAVETPEKLFVGGSYQFRLRLGSKQLSLAGRIRWCRLVATQSADDEAHPIFHAGVVFEDSVTSKAWRKALERLTGKDPYLIWHPARTRSEQAEAAPA